MARSLIIAFLFLLVPFARAQPAPRDQARVLFLEANALLDEGRFAEARDRLREALELYPIPAIAQNLVVALRGVGDGVAASDLAQRLAAGEFGAIDAAQAEHLAALRTSIEAEVAVLTVRVCGGDDVEVRIDGERWDALDGCRDLERRMNAGAHVIAASGAQRVPAERRITLARGQHLAIELTLEEVPTGTLIVRVPPSVEVEVDGIGRAIGGFTRTLPAGSYHIRAALSPAQEREVQLLGGASLEVTLGVGDDPWPWVVLGIVLGTLVAGGVAAIGIYFATNPSPPLRRDPIFGVTETLVMRW